MTKLSKMDTETENGIPGETEMAIDIGRTREYYRTMPPEDLCDCAYCRAYMRQVRAAYPEITEKLGTLGIDIEKPFETMPLVPGNDGFIDFIGSQYVVFGRPDQEAAEAVKAAGMQIARSHPFTDITEDHFVIETGEIRLKWNCNGEQEQ